MNFGADDLLACLEQLEASADPPTRYVIAFSGGLDSTVLAHVLASCRSRHGKELLAVHVDHRLHPHSQRWAAHCRRMAARLDVEFHCAAVDVAPDSGQGPEAAAREARYGVFREHVTAHDWLLSAHHRDDQAETLLLNLLRGSGAAGIAGIPRLRRFAGGWLARPLLAVARDALESYALQHDLQWITDPSNEATQYDRNFLRRDVLPLLESRWPNVGLRLARSATLARETSVLLDELADQDLGMLGDRIERLDTTALGRLSTARQKNVLRRAISRIGLAPLPSGKLESVVDQFLSARKDAQPMLRWEGGEIRRYRGRLYLMAAVPAADFAGVRLGSQPVSLGAGMGSLSLGSGDGPGLSTEVVRAGLCLRVRIGGEQIKPIGHTHTRKLKKLLQEKKVLPWMRDGIPLVYSGEQLVAVGDLWLAADAASSDGLAVCWHDRPALF